MPVNVFAAPECLIAIKKIKQAGAEVYS